ncbi:hypothetical protein IWQ47_004765 [Aquimarina sp. EL_43]|uniref:DUF1572 family protein n=1 Tax=unclassified Aquimarina TaxID=2627091 RepID=UPI0018CAE4E4|nr:MULTISPECIES: DUF1572 family protein [unclassified Aquimarina]MBG6133308.1 hypothetical protein [Aquimarina sp. EL_35]MBG6153513.1 hypothetical protein [Aquimarina sp. EL_32]MBG6171669.1 hypothetical protein [Aquimarina sp. EL_43]
MKSSEYLEGIQKQFAYYKSLGEKTIDQTPEEKLFWQYNNESNSIAIIVKHLWGNMKSRWTDFLTTDGEKEWRQRDAEFENDILSKKDLLIKWNDGWQCLFEALESIDQDNFNQPIYIRNIEHSITEAINRQLAHYSYHIGQIVCIGKMIVGEEWQSLSIPKGKSIAYNQKRFATPKHKAHYTDKLMKDGTN